PPGLPAGLREPEGLRQLAAAPDGRRLQHRIEVDRAHGEGRTCRPGEPCRAARHLPRSGWQPTLGRASLPECSEFHNLTRLSRRREDARDRRARQEKTMKTIRLLTAATLAAPLLIAAPDMAKAGDPVTVSDGVTIDPIIDGRIRYESVNQQATDADA